MALLIVNISKQFKKDLKKVKKQNKDIELLRKVVDILANGWELDIKYQ
ncbi:MAG: type II toxin-antitoxin system YafQ family toxin [Neisseriaceae bacterium]